MKYDANVRDVVLHENTYRILMSHTQLI
ncbi:hypothetical protein F383_21371 [Gossypium arboreum]|uniref:Uncharacterized protein n=1 Tax=Gossypium arboreum TaxID=29729 RepID=A0A0B0NZ04_GOSAR|nr:hypothetical protein F383_21371 [Gossypium arboreum]